MIPNRFVGGQNKPPPILALVGISKGCINLQGTRNTQPQERFPSKQEQQGGPKMKSVLLALLHRFIANTCKILF